MPIYMWRIIAFVMGKRYYNEWKAYFLGKYGPRPYCQVCGKILSWETGADNAVHWDHKHEFHAIRDVPYKWLRSRPVSEENIARWESEGFGMLCRQCNSWLPTCSKDRLKKAEAVLRYTKSSE